MSPSISPQKSGMRSEPAPTETLHPESGRAGRTRDDAAASAAPEGGIPTPATPPGGDDYHGQQFIGLQNVPRSADNVSIGRILQVRDRLLQISGRSHSES